MRLGVRSILAGSSRSAYYGARIDVHSASNGGASDGRKPVEDSDTLPATTIMARVGEQLSRADGGDWNWSRRRPAILPGLTR